MFRTRWFLAAGAVVALSISSLTAAAASSAPAVTSAATVVGPQEVTSLVSPDRIFSVDPTQGSLCVFETYGIASGPWWCSGVGSGAVSRLFIQSDGNLVLRDGAGRALWQSRTAGAGPHVSLTMQDDGNLVLRSPQGRAVWASGTWLLRLQAGQTMHPRAGLRGFFTLTTMQADGNLVQRTDDPNGGLGRAVWSSRTRVAGSSLTVQADGNMVIRAPSGAAVWSTRTNGRCAAPVLMQQYDQNLVLRSGTTGRACWASGVVSPP